MDEITEAFQNISVADFMRETSAMSESPLDGGSGTKGASSFNIFVDSMLEIVRKHAERPEEFKPWSVLRSPTLYRIFSPEEDETIADYSARLEREAAQMEATWFFTVLLSCGRAYDSDESPDPIDPDNQAEVEAALDRGEIQVALCWYADFIEKGERRRRAGIIAYDDGEPTEGIEGDIDADKNPFHQVMDK